MTNLAEIKTKLPETLILEFLNSNDDCTIDLVMLLELGVYRRKDHAVRALKRNFYPEEDYSPTKGKASQEGLSADFYLLTSDCFKQMCMLAETDAGKLVRRYYLEVEKRWKESLRLKQKSNTDLEKLVDELFEVLFEMLWNSADAIVNIKNCTARQQKNLKAEYKKGISKQVLYSLAQELMGDIGHNASHQHKEISKAASKRLEPYKEVFIAKFQEMQQSLALSSTSQLQLPPAKETPHSLWVKKIFLVRELRSSKAYKPDTWGDFCRKTWDIGCDQAAWLINAADVYERLERAEVEVLPSNEQQLRSLRGLDETVQVEVWKRAVRMAGGKMPSGRAVEEIVEQTRG